MNNNVLVIGNGFDLAHGLDTSYNDFIKYIKDEKYKKSSGSIDVYSDEMENIVENNGFIKFFLEYEKEVKGWVDLEKLMKDVISYFEEFLTKYTEFINPSNCFFCSERSGEAMFKVFECFEIFNEFYTQGGYNLGSVKLKYYNRTYGLNKKALLDMLKQQLDSLNRSLQLYLGYLMKTENQYIDSYSKIKPIQQIKEIDPSYVISFNYTDIYKIYGIKQEDVFHVHGSIDKNNMVLGFDDDDPKNLDFVYFKKYFQRIQKLTGYIDEDRFIKYDKGLLLDYPIIHFYGHSMDKTDGDIIQKLCSMASGFVIYKYNQEDYEQKVINLIDIFGKEQATQMIQTGFIKFVQCEK